MSEMSHDIGEYMPDQHIWLLYLRCLIMRDFTDFTNLYLKFKELRIYCNIYAKYRFKLKVYKEIINSYNSTASYKVKYPPPPPPHLDFCKIILFYLVSIVISKKIPQISLETKGRECRVKGI